MGSHELIALLAETTVAGSAAVLVVWLLRRPLRKAFGAVVGYALWAMVPAAIVAALLPAALAAPAVGPMALVLVKPPIQVLAAGAARGYDLTRGLSALWLLGMAAMVWRFARQQRAFLLGLGPLQRRADGLLQADGVAGLPAAIGLWRPVIVVPADFDSRYTPAQQRLMQAHERMHIRRGDLPINALATALRCVFWFNPLLHAAARRFRHDQELACDQRVIARHPFARREYGEAMFKTQLAAQPLPLGCHWLAAYGRRNHPLKERIMMLKQPAPSLSRWISGSALVLAISVAGAYAAWAAQPARHALPPQPVAKIGSASPVANAATTPVHDAKVQPASRAHNPPRYPAQALKDRIGGKVLLTVDVAADGSVTGVKVDRSEPAGVFDATAIEAVMKWTFEPQIDNGRAVPGQVRVPIYFSPNGPLKDESPSATAGAATGSPSTAATGSPSTAAPDRRQLRRR